MSRDEMSLCHQLNRHEFEQALGDSERSSLACCSPWGRKESDTTEWLNNDHLLVTVRDTAKMTLLGWPRCSFKKMLNIHQRSAFTERR